MHWARDICRICGEISPNCHPIYPKDVQDSALEDKLKKCLKLQVFKEDFKPKQLCNCCFVKLEDFCQFLGVCHATDAKFDSILLTRQWPSETILDYTQQKMSVIVTPKTIEQLDCNEIDLYKESVDLDAINEHEMLEIVENATYGGLPDNLDYLAPPTYSSKQNFYQEPTVLRHSSSFQTQENSCSSNVVINYSQQNLPTNNEALYQKNSETFPSIDYDPNLNYPSRIESTYNYIEKGVEATKQDCKWFQCPHCDRKFKRRVTLNSHIAIHTKIRPFVCEICKKSFAIKSDLTNHQKIHTDRNKCKFCSSAFIAPSKLERHLRTHTKDKPFSCDFKNCDKSFADKRNLDAHKLLHADGFNYSCGDCGKVFKTRNRLKQHGKSHTVSTPFVCEVCSQCYKYKSNLILHLKKHNGYYCQYCKKDCGGRTKLSRHKRACRVKLYLPSK